MEQEYVENFLETDYKNLVSQRDEVTRKLHYDKATYEKIYNYINSNT